MILNITEKEKIVKELLDTEGIKFKGFENLTRAIVEEIIDELLDEELETSKELDEYDTSNHTIRHRELLSDYLVNNIGDVKNIIDNAVIGELFEEYKKEVN